MVAEMAGAATSVVEDAEWTMIGREGRGRTYGQEMVFGERRNLAAQTGCQQDFERVGRLSWRGEWEQAQV